MPWYFAIGCLIIGLAAGLLAHAAFGNRYHFLEEEDQDSLYVGKFHIAVYNVEEDKWEIYVFSGDRLNPLYLVHTTEDNFVCERMIQELDKRCG